MILGIDAANIRLGGGVTHLVELLSAFDPNNSSFKRIIVWGSRQTLSQIPNFHWLEKRTAVMLNSRLFFRTFWQYFMLGLEVKKANCDLLFVPGGVFMNSYAPVVTMNQNLLPFEKGEIARYGWSLRALKFIVLGRLQSNSFRNSNGVIFLSKYAQGVVKKVVKNFQTESIVVPHGMSKHFIHNEPKDRFNKALGITTPIKIIYVSNIDLYKHQAEVIKGIFLLKSKGYLVELLLIGPSVPAALDELLVAMKKYDSNGDWIRYIGEVPHSKIADYYQNSDIGIFASSCETFGITLLEKMACALPIASSDKSCLPEVLEDGGLYFDPESAQSIASAIEKYIQSPELRERMSKRADILAAEYSWEKCASSTFTFLEKVAREYIK